MKVGLYFGSFNPFHKGHLAVAQFFSSGNGLDELRLIVSPQNPLKGGELGENSIERLNFVREAVARNNLRVVVSDIEYHLSKPLYTINTLRHLKDLEPNNEFILIMGADILGQIESWHKYKELLNEFEVWVYPREGFDGAALCKKYGTVFKDAPPVNISGTIIREGEEKGEDMSSFRA